MTALNPTNPPLVRSCMRDVIRDTIINRILDGTYIAGKRLIELNLAREFGVSQAPVREALRELEAQGLVKSERYRGTHVRCPDALELRESYEMRALLEERAAQLIVPCTSDVLAKLQADLLNMHLAADSGDDNRYANAAIHFHRTIVEQSGNRFFLSVWDTLHIEVRVRFAAHRFSQELQSYADEHDVILSALREGNGPQAGQLLRKLLDRVAAAVES